MEQFTTIQCDDSAGNGGTETHTFITDIGVVYFVYVAHFSTFSSTTGTFDISMTCTAPPTPPECATIVAPTDGAMNQDSEITLEWAAPASGDAPTSYDVYFGDISGDLVNTNLLTTNTTGTTWTITGLSFSTTCLLYTSPSPRDLSTSRMPSSA